MKEYVYHFEVLSAYPSVRRYIVKRPWKTGLQKVFSSILGKK